MRSLILVVIGLLLQTAVMSQKLLLVSNNVEKGDTEISLTQVYTFDFELSTINQVIMSNAQTENVFTIDYVILDEVGPYVRLEVLYKDEDMVKGSLIILLDRASDSFGMQVGEYYIYGRYKHYY